MSRRAPLLWLLLTACGLVACDSSDPIEDGGAVTDATAAADAGRRDATAPVDGGDAALPVDLGLDAEPLDAGPADAEPGADVEPLDAGPADAEPAELGVADAEPADSGPSLPPCGRDFDAVGQAQLRITADDARTVYLNGSLQVPYVYGWGSPTNTGVPIYLHPRRPNALALHAENVFVISGYDRGVVAELTYTTSTAITSSVITSSTTRVATATVADWTLAEFDDSAWDPATVQGPHGMAPWGDVLGSSSAEWVWSYDSNLPAGNKPGAEDAFFRMRFYVHRDHRLYPYPEACEP